jgi:translation initiation factor 2B subunit (eIF-2B alpha/beta/delta family)
MNKEKRLKKIFEDIKKIKIQGATNIAKAALYAYSLSPTRKTEKILLSLRPTEPMLMNVLHLVGEKPKKEVLAHFKEAQDKINKNVFNLIKNNSVIFTHCHSANVIKALIYAKKHGKKFEVYNTETRPLYQGRKTSKELAKTGVKVTTFIDSAAAMAIEKENKKDKVYADILFFGADAILKEGVINKVGSGMFAEIAYNHKIPVYIIADSWKYFPRNLKIEERDFHEVWKRIPKHIKVRDPAFEKINKNYITAIVSEFGIFPYNKFLEKVKNRRL